jgi:DNA-binding response OmpR family regulator
VGTGFHALQAIRDVAFDIAVVDMSLPDLDGVEIIRRIRMDYPHVRILAVSGMMASVMQTAARTAGADDTLLKPYTCRKVRETVYALSRAGDRNLRCIRMTC